MIRRHFEVMKISQRHVDDFGGISQQKGFGKFRNAGSGPRIIIASTAIYYSFSHKPLQL